MVCQLYRRFKITYILQERVHAKHARLEACLTHPSVQFPFIANDSVLDAKADFVRQLVNRKEEK